MFLPHSVQFRLDLFVGHARKNECLMLSTIPKYQFQFGNPVLVFLDLLL